MKGKTCLTVFLVLLGLFVLGVVVLAAPLLPVPQNPPVVQEPAWDSPQTRELAQRACFDCHSNETIWPWYSRSLAAAWLVRKDVNEGRRVLNFSEWGVSTSRRGEEEEGEGESEDAGEVVLEGEMPPFQYIILHPEARLTAAEKQQLAAGLDRLR